MLILSQVPKETKYLWFAFMPTNAYNSCMFHLNGKDAVVQCCESVEIRAGVVVVPLPSDCGDTNAELLEFTVVGVVVMVHGARARECVVGLFLSFVMCVNELA